MRRWIALFALVLTGCAAVSAAPALNTSSGAQFVRSVHGVVSALESKPFVKRAKKVVTTSAPTSTHAPAGAAAPRSPSPPSTPRHNPTGDGYHGSIAALIRSTFGSAAPTALCIAWRESRFNPYAKNPHSSASGIFQMTRIWWDGRWHFNPFNAYLNVTYAHRVYERYGWGPWGGGC